MKHTATEVMETKTNRIKNEKSRAKVGTSADKDNFLTGPEFLCHYICDGIEQRSLKSDIFLI